MAYLTGFGQLDPVTGLPKKSSGAFTTGAYGAPAPIGLGPSTSPYMPSLPPLPGGGTTGGGVGGGPGAGSQPFDVKALLDSLLNPIQADLTAQGQYDLAGRNAGINRALVQFGALPDFNQAQQALGLNLGEVVAPDTARLASENPYSATKQLAQYHTDAVRQIKQALAARGLLQSGTLGYELNREQQQYGQAQYDARQKLLDMLSGIQQGYLAGQRAGQQTLANAANSALAQLLSLFPGGFPTGGNGGGGQQSAPPPPPAQHENYVPAYGGGGGQVTLPGGVTIPKGWL